MNYNLTINDREAFSYNLQAAWFEKAALFQTSPEAMGACFSAGLLADTQHPWEGAADYMDSIWDRYVLPILEGQKIIQVGHGHCPAPSCYWRIQYTNICSRCRGETVQKEDCC